MRSVVLKAGLLACAVLSAPAARADGAATSASGDVQPVTVTKSPVVELGIAPVTASYYPEVIYVSTSNTDGLGSGGDKIAYESISSVEDFAGPSTTRIVYLH